MTACCVPAAADSWVADTLGCDVLEVVTVVFSPDKQILGEEICKVRKKIVEECEYKTLLTQSYVAWNGLPKQHANQGKVASLVCIDPFT